MVPLLVLAALLSVTANEEIAHELAEDFWEEPALEHASPIQGSMDLQTVAEAAATSKAAATAAGRIGKGGGGDHFAEEDGTVRASDEERKHKVVKVTNHTLGIVLTAVALVLFGFVVYHSLMRPAEEHARRHSSAGLVRESTAGVLECAMVNHDYSEEVISRSCDTFPEDTYSLAVALIVLDLHSLASKQAKKRALRYARIAFSLALIFVTTAIQTIMLVGTKMYVTPQAVSTIRHDYEAFEHHMYDGNTYLTENGKERGMDGFFNATLFETLNGELKQSICNIPMSQLFFISLALLVWSITCFASIKNTIEQCLALVIFASTLDSMEHCLKEGDDGEGETEGCDGAGDCDDGIEPLIIVGLTWPVKVFFLIFVFIPDLATTTFVLWLGSRWLIATPDFSNVISNAVALEFILGLKFLLFYALVSERNKRDLAHTGLKAPWSREPAGYGIYFGALMWLIAAMIWVQCYLSWQTVLPDYKWDVRQVCSPWLASQLDPDSHEASPHVAGGRGGKGR
jgi:hypothetical protein